jgi:hypothetical protein
MHWIALTAILLLCPDVTRLTTKPVAAMDAFEAAKDPSIRNLLQKRAYLNEQLADDTVTVSQYLFDPNPRKPKPPEVMAVVAPVTDCKRVVPFESKTLPTIVPLLPQSTSRRWLFSTNKDGKPPMKFVEYRTPERFNRTQ